MSNPESIEPGLPELETELNLLLARAGLALLESDRDILLSGYASFRASILELREEAEQLLGPWGFA